MHNLIQRIPSLTSKKINLNLIRSEGYSFFIESIYIIHRLTDKITEFPIFFYDRQSGNSKISKIEIFKSVFCLGKLFYKRIFHDKWYLDVHKSSIPFIPCPNCNSPYQSIVAVETYGDSKEKLQCLQCGKMFI